MKIYEKWERITQNVHQSKSMAAFDKALKVYSESSKDDTETNEALLEELRLRFKKWMGTLMDENLQSKMSYIEMIMGELPELNRKKD